MNTLDNQYHTLLKRVLDYGIQKDDRTGTGTLSVFGGQFIHDMSEGFPLLTTKKMAVKTMMTELKWFLKGDTNIKYLVDNGCNIWNGDAYKAYQNAIAEVGLFDAMMDQEEFIERIKTDDAFAMQWGELGPIYGKQWRRWSHETGEIIDQIHNLINDLKTNPDSRRLMVNAWNVGELHQMTLPPCHYGFQVYTRVLRQNERWTWYQKKTGNTMHHDHIEQEMDQEGVPTRAISLAWNQRSVDTFLGLPFNIASYGLLLELIAREVNMIPDELIGNLGDVHLYKNHIEQAKEQLKRDPIMLPELNIVASDILSGEFAYDLIGYESHKSIK